MSQQAIDVGSSVRRLSTNQGQSVTETTPLVSASSRRQQSSPPRAASSASPDSKPGQGRRWFGLSQNLDLPNVGSVARDHLANERTFLAWVRTSLSISGVGIAITQLFRLQSVDTRNVGNLIMPFHEVSGGSALNVGVQVTDLVPQQAHVIALSEQIALLERRLDALASQHNERSARYRQLARPLGGSFLLLGMLFLFMGGYRYISVQHHLASSNRFPPAKRSVLLVSLSTGMLLVSALVGIVAIALT